MPKPFNPGMYKRCEVACAYKSKCTDYTNPSTHEDSLCNQCMHNNNRMESFFSPITSEDDDENQTE